MSLIYCNFMVQFTVFHPLMVYFIPSLFLLPGFKSDIIGHLPQLQNQLMDWLSEEGYGGNYWVPCYRGSLHGWQSVTFHGKCDHKGPTLTLARKNSYLFGGFADQSWKSTSLFHVSLFQFMYISFDGFKLTNNLRRYFAL